MIDHLDPKLRGKHLLVSMAARTFVRLSALCLRVVTQAAQAHRVVRVLTVSSPSIVPPSLILSLASNCRASSAFSSQPIDWKCFIIDVFSFANVQTLPTPAGCVLSIPLRLYKLFVKINSSFSIRP